MKNKILQMLLIAFFMLNSSCSPFKPTNGVYLIPEGYIGEVIILFNQPDGIIPEVENGLFVYKIPKDGILKVKTQSVLGAVNLSYFYVSENGNRQKVEYLRITGDTDINGKPKDKFDGQLNQGEYENRVFIMNIGGLGSFNTKNSVVQYTSFLVGTPKESGILYDVMQKRISKIQREIMQKN
jgi:hypothetical protein